MHWLLNLNQMSGAACQLSNGAERAPLKATFSCATVRVRSESCSTGSSGYGEGGCAPSGLPTNLGSYPDRNYRKR